MHWALTAIDNRSSALPKSHSKSEARGAQYSARFLLAYKLAAAVVIVLAGFWGIMFAVAGWWTLASAQAVLVLVCLMSLGLAAVGGLATALLLTQIAFLGLIVGLCLIFDVPSAAAPRVTHIFLLAVALVGFLNYKREPSVLQLTIIAMALGWFVFLASSMAALPWANPIPDAVRVYGAWINVGIATLMLAGGTYVLQLELERSDRRAHELKRALWNKEFELHLQPQVNQSGQILGAEALLRWKHATRGYVPPVEFIPLAESAGLMSEIGHWVLVSACGTLAQWSAHPQTAGLTLAVNVSASQFLDEDFEQSVIQLIDTFEVNPALLKLELTESVMVANPELVATKMNILRSVGVGMSLDDFGTGYSSLSYLRRLPLNQLKIDRSFVQDIAVSERSAALARSIIQIGRDLGLKVLAEGVETTEQFAFLRDNGCEEFQGHYFGRPMPQEQFASLFLQEAA